MTGPDSNSQPRPPQPPAPEKLVQDLYQELRRLAQAKLAALPSSGKGLTLQATALVHEAYVRLSGRDGRWSQPGEFFAAAAVAMRDILVERARRRARLRHGGGLRREELGSSIPDPAKRAEPDILELDRALRRLEKSAPRAAQVVMLRFFAGCSVEQTAQALGVSEPTVKREWAFAKAWIYRALRDGSVEEPSHEPPEPNESSGDLSRGR